MLAKSHPLPVLEEPNWRVRRTRLERLAWAITLLEHLKDMWNILEMPWNNSLCQTSSRSPNAPWSGHWTHLFPNWGDTSLILWEHMGGPRRILLCPTQLKRVGESKKAPWQELTTWGNPWCSHPPPAAHLQSVPYEELSTHHFPG